MSSGKSDLIDIACEIRHQTAKAFLIFDGKKEVWLAKSLTEDNNDGTVTIPEWLAQKEGLI